MKIGIVNGPNLNLLGTREPEIYGDLTLDQIERLVAESVSDSDVELRFEQSNSEGEILDIVQEMREEWQADAFVINPGAYSHYSLAIRDLISALDVPVVEVHLTNTSAREEFRRASVTAGACAGKIEGLGWTGYLLAILYLSSN